MIPEHGGNIYGYGDILDMSANINPLGILLSVRDAVISSASRWERYPDPFCTELREKLAEKEKYQAENIVCGNGADDLIYRLVHGLKPKKSVVCAPTFGEYTKALAENGCEIREHFLYEADDFEVTEKLFDMLTPGTDIVFLCSPNNPTGRLISPEILEKAAEICSDIGALLVADECFSGFAGSRKEWRKNGNCVILKAFTKLYAMPGLRLGYALCGNEEIAIKLGKSGQYWSVSVPAQAGGIAALDEDEYVRKTVELISRERRILAEKLTETGIKVFPSDANYLLFKGPSGLDAGLLNMGILIRNCSNYTGLGDGFYRTAVRSHAENMRFIEALRRCVNG